MRRKRIWSAAAAVTLAMASIAAGCGDDDDGGDSGSGDSGGDVGKVAVLLPDSKSSVRWETYDRPLLQKAFDDAGVEADISNAEGDKSTQQQQAEQAITNGAKVLLLVNLDSGSGAAIAANAKSQGVKVIDYDRLTLDTDANDYYVSFDNTKVGELQGQGLVDCVGNKQGAQIAVLNGSPTDNNATLFKNGYDSVINPKFDSGDWKEIGDQSVPDWDNQKALTIFEQMLQANNNKVDGVLRGQRRPRQRRDLGPKAAQAAAGAGDRPGRDARGHPEHRQRRSVHDGVQAHQAGGGRGSRSGYRACQGREAERDDQSGRQRNQEGPVGSAHADRDHEGQHQGLPRRGGLPDQGRHLRREGRSEVHGARPLEPIAGPGTPQGVPGRPPRNLNEERVR